MIKNVRNTMWLVVLFVFFTLSGAQAEKYVFDNILGSIEITDDFVVLYQDTILELSEWLEGRGTNTENVVNDFAARGVLLQAWSQTGDLCFEVTATQNEDTLNVFDVNEQSSAYRGQYRLGHYPENNYYDQGYEFSGATWTTSEAERFLALPYIKRLGQDIIHRGYMRRTIRNGYEITFDMQVHGRKPTTKDNNLLNKFWKTFDFVEVLPLPPKAEAKIIITDILPVESNKKELSIEGSATEGVTLTTVVMGLNYITPIVENVTLSDSGKFTLPITLPQEGVFLVTLMGEYKGQTVLERAYPVTYKESLLAISFNTEIPAVVTTDELEIVGRGEPNANIQVFMDGESIAKKRITGEGKFKITIETQEEGPHELIIVFSKRGLADRRYVYQITRQWTQEDMIARLKKQAIKPSYSQLTQKIDGYIGKTMGYAAYMLTTQQSGTEWLTQMALRKSGETYSDFIWVTSQEKPNMAPNQKTMMYGTCLGLPQGDAEAENQFPCFALLIFASIE